MFYHRNLEMHISTNTKIYTHKRKHTRRRNLNTHLFKSISLLYAWLGTKPSSDGIKNGAFEFVSSSLTPMTILYIEWDLFITIRNIKYSKVFSVRRFIIPLCIQLYHYWMIQLIENTNIYKQFLSNPWTILIQMVFNHYRHHHFRCSGP